MNNKKRWMLWVGIILAYWGASHFLYRTHFNELWGVRGDRGEYHQYYGAVEFIVGIFLLGSYIKTNFGKAIMIKVNNLFESGGLRNNWTNNIKYLLLIILVAVVLSFL